MAKQSKTTVILGGNGKTGRRVAQRLAALGRPVRVASRSTPIPFDWNDERTWQPALAGAGSIYLVYYPDLAVPGAAEHVDRVSQLAARCGVERIVLLSGRGEPQVRPAEDAVRRCGVDVTILECAFFCQNFSEGLVAPVNGTVVFPAGDVAEPFVDCDDIADVAVTALTEDGHGGQTYELTGPRALTFAEATQAIAAASREPLTYSRVSFEQYGQILQRYMPASHVELFIELLRHLLDGHNSHTTNDVERVLGRPAKSFHDFAREASGAM